MYGHKHVIFSAPTNVLATDDGRQKLLIEVGYPHLNIYHKESEISVKRQGAPFKAMDHFVKFAMEKKGFFQVLIFRCIRKVLAIKNPNFRFSSMISIASLMINNFLHFSFCNLFPCCKTFNFLYFQYIYAKITYFSSGILNLML